MKTAFDISNKPEENKFIANVDGQTAYIEYNLYKDAIALMHTVVPEEIGGKGIATALVKYAFAYAKENGLRVKPYCSFVVDFINKHPEYKEQI